MDEQVTLDQVQADEEVAAYIEGAHDHLKVMGFTEHGRRHVELVARIAFNVLDHLGFPERPCQLAAVAGYLHDIGNVISRHMHPETGAVLAWHILRRLGMPAGELATVSGAIGNHEAGRGGVVNAVGAALILADKSDVHRSRVQGWEEADGPSQGALDLHDRVNHAVEHSFLRVRREEMVIGLELTVDTGISPVMEYFEIFLERMLMCRRAAAFLDCEFELTINENRLL